MDVGKYIKNQNGFALVYTIGITILVTLIMTGIFLMAKSVYTQVEMGDKLSQMKDVEEYAVEEVATALKEEINKKISSDEIANISLGDDATVLNGLMTNVEAELGANSIKKRKLGKKDQFSYDTVIQKKSVTKVFPYELYGDSSIGGWQLSNTMNVPNTTNCKVVFDVKITVKEKDDKGDIAKERVAKNEFVYEIQWEKHDFDKDVLAMDVWRNVYYQYKNPQETSFISADTWMRKMQQIYEYQQNTPAYIQTFPYNDFNENMAQTLGVSGSKLIDYQDRELLDFWNNKPIGNKIDIKGSLLLNHGVRLQGNANNSEIKVHNMLALRNDKNPSLKKNVIKNIDIKAGTGIYVNVNGEENQLIVENEEGKNIVTPNLLINDTTDNYFLDYLGYPEISVVNGFTLAKGRITIGEKPNGTELDLQNYTITPRTKKPDQYDWSQFMDGGLVVASSSLIISSVDLNESSLNINTDIEDKREIEVSNGNFMLTSAKLSSKTGETGFSYYLDGTKGHNKGSHLNMDGPNTKMVVKNYSYIDAPKNARRLSKGETGYVENPENIYNYDSQRLNMIVLGSGSYLDLGTVGVEPFTLICDYGSTIRMKLLPELEFFDHSFLIGRFTGQGSNVISSITGKVIIEPFNQEDTKRLEQKLKNDNVPVRIETDIEKVTDGVVTLIMPENTRGKEAPESINRKFSYIDKVKY